MMNPPNVLIVDDEEDMRLGLSEILQEKGYKVDTAADGVAALEKVRQAHFDLALVDLQMPGPDGMTVLDSIKRISPETLVVIITGFATVESAVEAMKLGAYDYLAKPFKLDQVRLVVARAAEQKRLSDENRHLRQEVASYHHFEQIVGRSEEMQRLFRAIKTAASTPSTVLICGETGTGKELVARALHRQSARAEGAFVAVSCGAVDDNLLASELFGHVRGAFTDATSDREGFFEAADGGTLFLDEIGDVPPNMQMKLLRVLQEREIQRVGETRTRRVDVRLVAATNKDLRVEMEEDRFREDLYYRLNVMTFVVPPLRERREDIPLLAHHFLQKYSREIGKAVSEISDQALERLLAHDWPGNVRELENTIERAVIFQEGAVLRPEHLTLDAAEAEEKKAATAGQLATLDEMERRHIARVLAETGYHQNRAAAALGIGRRTLYRKIREYGIEVPTRAGGEVS